MYEDEDEDYVPTGVKTVKTRVRKGSSVKVEQASTDCGASLQETPQKDNDPAPELSRYLRIVEHAINRANKNDKPIVAQALRHVFNQDTIHQPHCPQHLSALFSSCQKSL